jgi:hypothetical protein
MLLTCSEPLQPRNDLLEVVYRYVAPLLSEAVAEKAVQELEILPAILTANHHGVDFLAQSLQGSFLFSLRLVGGKPATTVPVFACGNVALNNSTYPKGLLLYDINQFSTYHKIPIRIPVFPDRWKRMSVCLVNSYDEKMLARSKKYLFSNLQQQIITPILANTANKILEEDYLNNTVISLKKYSQQAVILNNRIWKRCFQEPDKAPEMIYLELEKITTLLLYLDLRNENSLIWQMLFNPLIRSKIIYHLDGTRACWDQAKLNNRFFLKPDNTLNNNGGCGTNFFWGIDDAGCRIPLILICDNIHQEPVLCGRDDEGNILKFPLNPDSIINELKSGRLLPSLITCYSIIAFSRGISCCGGYFQAEYLSNIQDVIVNTLNEIIDFSDFATQIAKVPSDIYLSGMQAIMRDIKNNMLLPTGPVEIIANGGLSNLQLKKLASLTVFDTHMAGVMETLPDFFSPGYLPANWNLLLAKDFKQLINDQNAIIL